MKARPWRPGLQTQIVAGIVVLLAFQGIAAVLVLGGDLRRSMMAQLDERTGELARHLADLAVDPVLTEQRLDLQVLLSKYVEVHGEAQWAYVCNAQGAVVSHTFTSGFPRGLRSDVRTEAAPGADLRIIDTELGRFHEVSAPLLDGAAGRVYVAVSEQPAIRAFRKATAGFLAVLGVIVLAGAMLMAWYALRIVRPVLAVTRAARALASGRSGTRVEVAATGEVAGLALAFNDMAGDIKRFRRELTLASEYKDNILRSLSEALVFLEPDGRIQELNPAACGLLGWQADDLAGQPAEAIFPTGAAGFIPRPPWATIRNLETTMLAKDGRVIPVLLSVSIVHGPGDEVQAVVCAAREALVPATPLKRAEATGRTEPAGGRASASGSARYPG